MREVFPVSAKVPLVLKLDDSAATVEAAGGKGASLGRLSRAGFAVPDGLVVTTGAYREFVARAGLREPLQAVLARVSAADPGDPASAEAAARRIGELFAAAAVPEEIANVVTAAYAELGEDVAVAVRSSATAEDRPDVSAAGQQDTFLDVRGANEVLGAVRRCWASLWTARAIAYRARAGFGTAEVSIAVVVQRFVAADAAGVLFTVDPVSGGRDHVVVNANWGLGEAVAAGRVTPDVAVVGRDGAVADYRVGGKELMTVAAASGPREQDTPASLRDVPVLSAAEAGELARVGVAVEELFGQPVDLEWARADHRLFVLQARPVTGLDGTLADSWNDSLDGDYLWSAGNLGEALPDVMTPATWSFIQLFMTRTFSPPSVPGYRGYGRVGGRFYMNVSVSASLSAAIGMPVRRFATVSQPVLGKLPDAAEIPRVPMPRGRIIRLTIPKTVRLVRRARRNTRLLPAFVADAPARADALRDAIARAGDGAALAGLWASDVSPFFVAASDMLAASSTGGAALLGVPGRLAARVGSSDAILLLSGQVGGEGVLASLGPAVGLARLARGEIDRDTFARAYGHRGPHEAEVYFPRPAEDPGWVDRQLATLAGAAHDAEELLARQEAARAAVWARLEGSPRRARKVRALVSRWAQAARTREAARSELIRAFWVLRAWVLRAGELTGRGDDVFFLGWPEILTVLRGDPSPLGEVPGRRAAYQAYRALPAYPALIRGRFDPFRWAADPDRRGDFYDERTAPAPQEEITGFPGAAGVVEGTARLIRAPEDADRLGAGEILVTTSTNIGWTLFFPRAAAVVTDVGAPLSHAAIVARELGIPAVVGCGNATMRLRSGDRIRVDGGRGTVQLLERGS